MTNMFTCMECGGTVKMAAKSGRKRIIRVIARNQEVSIPDDFLIPTCEVCGENYINKQLGEELDSLLRPNYIPLPKPQWPTPIKKGQWWMYVVTDPRDFPIKEYPWYPVRIERIESEYTAIAMVDGMVLKISFASLLYTWRWVYLGDKELPNQQ